MQNEFIIKNGAVLAPMAGVSDSAMRIICKQYGAAFTVGEMCSSNALQYNDKKSVNILNIQKEEQPCGSQIFGSSPQHMAYAAEIASSYSPAFIDINMGCPAPKVIKSGGGSILMSDQKQCYEIIKAVVSAVKEPISVKMRAGYTNDCINAVYIAKIAEQAGASFITVHGRTRPQMYAPPVNLDIIRDVKQAVTIPVIGNGDIFTPQDARKMIDYTGCDMVMVGRGACGSPWIFNRINHYLTKGELLEEPSISEKMDILKQQVKLMIKYKGNHIAMLESRKHSAWYLKNMHSAAKLRERCGKITSYDELEEICELTINLNKI